MAGYEQQLRTQKAQQLEMLERQLLGVHSQDFDRAQRRTAAPPLAVNREELVHRFERDEGVPELRSRLAGKGTPPKASPPERVDQAEILARERANALRGVPLLRFAERRAAKELAARRTGDLVAAETERRRQLQADEQRQLDAAWSELTALEAAIAVRVNDEAKRETEARQLAHALAQESLDEEWRLLNDNDPDTVIAVLDRVLIDCSLPAGAAACRDACASLLVLHFNPDVVPAERPDWTPGGRRTIKKRSKTDQNRLYLAAMASTVLASVKASLAAAPVLKQVEVVVAREQGGVITPLFVGRFDRERFADPSAANPEVTILGARDVQLEAKGRTEELAPLDLSDQPRLQSMLVSLERA